MILIVGVPFTGKTVSACTFPKPLLLLDYDGGFESVKNTKNPDGSLVVPDWKNITIIQMGISKPNALDMSSPSEMDFKKGKSPAYAQNSAGIVEKYNDIMGELFIDGCVTIDGKKVGPFKSLVIDPLTTVFRTWQDGILYVNRVPGLRIGDYKTLEKMLYSQFLPSLKSLQNKIPWIVCIDHETIDKDELSGAITEFPIGPSYNMGRSLAKEFSEVFRSRVEGGKFVWRTKAHGRFEGAGSRFNLPDPLFPATYQELKKHLSTS